MISIVFFFFYCLYLLLHNWWQRDLEEFWKITFYSKNSLFSASFSTGEKLFFKQYLTALFEILKKRGKNIFHSLFLKKCRLTNSKEMCFNFKNFVPNEIIIPHFHSSISNNCANVHAFPKSSQELKINYYEVHYHKLR